MTSVGGIPLPFTISEGCHDATGGLAGGQIGYRWQATNWVFGLEAQGDWADLKGSNTSAVGALAGFPYSNQTKIDAIGLFTGQVGYAWNNVLLYAKGGAAVVDNSYSHRFTLANQDVLLNSATDTRWGGTIGSVAPSTAHQVTLDLVPDGSPSSFTMEPPGYHLHLWQPGAGVITHTSFVGQFSVHPFILDPDYPAFDANLASGSRREVSRAE